MNTATKTKIREIEIKFEALKKLMKDQLDLRVDEKNWQTIARDVKKARRRGFKRAYGKE